jgi:hypothetical protein
MKIETCLLDLDYEEIDGNISTLLYGRTPDRQEGELKNQGIGESQKRLVQSCKKDTGGGPQTDFRKEIEAAVKLVRRGIKMLNNRKIELKDLVACEQLTKPIREYKLTSPHIFAAKKLMAKGIPVNVGSVVGF